MESALPASTGHEGSPNDLKWMKMMKNHMPRCLGSLDLNLIVHIWAILKQPVRHRSPPPSPKHQLREYILEEWCAWFQRLYAKVQSSYSDSL